MQQAKCHPCNKPSVKKRNTCNNSSVTHAINQVSWQAKCQEEEYMQQVKGYLCNKPSVMTHEEYIQQAKCQEEWMQQAKFYPCNKPSVKENTCNNQVLPMQ